MARSCRLCRPALLAVVVLLLAATTLHAAISTVRVASGLERPLFVTAPPGDGDRLFIVEQYSGRIRVLNLADGTINAAPFLTFSGLAEGGEQGLLGLAFHPNYADNGTFFVNLTVAGGDTEIRRYQVSGDPNVADAGSGQLVLGYDQPQSNHNGGWLGFGPDGYLYISSGDGGGGNDDDAGHTPGIGNAQDITDNLLGKLLRIDVDGDDFPQDAARNYAIPPSNPFVGQIGDDEIWSYGLRNPWRASFDRGTGDLYIGDVGQALREEIDHQPASSTGGGNYGWSLREGTAPTPVGGGPRPQGAIDPIHEYSRGTGDFQGFSVTGGYVYRGPIAEIQGHYFFADYLSENIWTLVFDGSDPVEYDGSNYTSLVSRTQELAPGGALSIDEISSFGEDDAGHLYIVDLGGEIFRIVAVSTTTTTTLPPIGSCGDPVQGEGLSIGPGAVVTASDALFVLRASVGSEPCAPCVCDVDDSTQITASDALLVLQEAVSGEGVLDCPPC